MTGPEFESRLRLVYEQVRPLYDAHKSHPMLETQGRTTCTVDDWCGALTDSIFEAIDGQFPADPATLSLLLRDTPDLWEWYAENGGSSVADYAAQALRAEAYDRVFPRDRGNLDPVDPIVTGCHD